VARADAGRRLRVRFGSRKPYGPLTDPWAPYNSHAVAARLSRTSTPTRTQLREPEERGLSSLRAGPGLSASQGGLSCSAVRFGHAYHPRRQLQGGNYRAAIGAAAARPGAEASTARPVGI
jgi:hypothetical protein